MTVDGARGGTLDIRDAVEGNASLGCLTIEGNLFEPPAPGIAPQPCSGCASPGFAPAKKAACACGAQAGAGAGAGGAAVRECCSS